MSVSVIATQMNMWCIVLRVATNVRGVANVLLLCLMKDIRKNVNMLGQQNGRGQDE
jgi:hypothetical protein